jgi:hypothetical protein
VKKILFAGVLRTRQVIDSASPDETAGPRFGWPQDEKQMNSPPNFRQNYETTDLTLASYLSCRDFRIEDIKRQGSRTTFVFADGPQLRAAVLDYANDGPVSVRSFCSTMRDLKAITR